jgi:hypothetical protein
VITSLEDGLWLPNASPRHKKEHVYKLKVKWTRKLNLLSLIALVNKNIYQQGKQLITPNLTT